MKPIKMPHVPIDLAHKDAAFYQRVSDFDVKAVTKLLNDTPRDLTASWIETWICEWKGFYESEMSSLDDEVKTTVKVKLLIALLSTLRCLQLKKEASLEFKNLKPAALAYSQSAADDLHFTDAWQQEKWAETFGRCGFKQAQFTGLLSLSDDKSGTLIETAYFIINDFFIAWFQNAVTLSCDDVMQILEFGVAQESLDAAVDVPHFWEELKNESAQKSLTLMPALMKGINQNMVASKKFEQLLFFSGLFPLQKVNEAFDLIMEAKEPHEELIQKLIQHTTLESKTLYHYVALAMSRQVHPKMIAALLKSISKRYPNTVPTTAEANGIWQAMIAATTLIDESKLEMFAEHRARLRILLTQETLLTQADFATDCTALKKSLIHHDSDLHCFLSTLFLLKEKKIADAKKSFLKCIDCLSSDTQKPRHALFKEVLTRLPMCSKQQPGFINFLRNLVKDEADLNCMLVLQRFAHAFPANDDQESNLFECNESKSLVTWINELVVSKQPEELKQISTKDRQLLIQSLSPENFLDREEKEKSSIKLSDQSMKFLLLDNQCLANLLNRVFLSTTKPSTFAEKKQKQGLSSNQQLTLFSRFYPHLYQERQGNMLALRSIYMEAIYDWFTRGGWRVAPILEKQNLVAHLCRDYIASHSSYSSVIRDLAIKHWQFSKSIDFLKHLGDHQEQIIFMEVLLREKKDYYIFDYEEPSCTSLSYNQVKKIILKVDEYKTTPILYQMLLAALCDRYYLTERNYTHASKLCDFIKAGIKFISQIKTESKALKSTLSSEELRINYTPPIGFPYVEEEIVRSNFGHPLILLFVTYKECVIFTKEKLVKRLQAITELPALAPLILEYLLSRAVESKEELLGWGLGRGTHRNKTEKIKAANLLIRFTRGQITLADLNKNEALKNDRLALIFAKAVKLYEVSQFVKSDFAERKESVTETKVVENFSGSPPRYNNITQFFSALIPRAMLPQQTEETELLTIPGGSSTARSKSSDQEPPVRKPGLGDSGIKENRDPKNSLNIELSPLSSRTTFG